MVTTRILLLSFRCLLFLYPTMFWQQHGHPINDDFSYGFCFYDGVLCLLNMLINRFIIFGRSLPQGKHLWLRNNFSTFTSQFIDTLTVLFLLCSSSIIEWDLFGKLLLSGFLFKVIITALDTPFLYLVVLTRGRTRLADCDLKIKSYA